MFIQEYFWIIIHFYLVKQFKIELIDIFLIFVCFQIFYVCQSYHCVSVRFFSCILLIPAEGQIVTTKISHDEFFFEKTFMNAPPQKKTKKNKTKKT